MEEIQWGAEEPLITPQEEHSQAGEEATPTNQSEIPATTGLNNQHEVWDEWVIVDGALSDDEVLIISKMQEIAKDPDRRRIPVLKGINRKKVLKELRVVNSILAKIPTTNVTQSNDLLYVASVVVTEKRGVKIATKREKKELMWKRRLENQVKALRRDLSRVECLTTVKTLKASIMSKLERKNNIHAKGLPVVKEELKQRLVAKAGKIKKYSIRSMYLRKCFLLHYLYVMLLNYTLASKGAARGGGGVLECP